MQKKSVLQQLIIGLVVLMSTGTLVHDLRLNKALQLSAPLETVSVNISSHLGGMEEASSAHTHVEKPSLSQYVSGIPRVQARDDHRKYNLAKYASRTNSNGGGSLLLWPSV